MFVTRMGGVPDDVACSTWTPMVKMRFSGWESDLTTLSDHTVTELVRMLLMVQ